MIPDPKFFASLSNRLRVRDLSMLARAGLGHPGGDLSVMDILVALYFDVLHVDPAVPYWPERDRLILSKGHCAGALYVVLAERGFFPKADLDTFAQNLSPLNAHPNRTKISGVETNTGPLGHGLPVGVGCALGAKIDRAAWRTFVIVGDGELQEGSNWEAILFATHRGLDNLVMVIDRNRLQLSGSTETINRLDSLVEKFTAFGWAVREVDGHDFNQLLAAFHSLPFESGKPSCLIAHTNKGKGVSFMQDNPSWHHGAPTPNELQIVLKELEGLQE